MSKDIKVTDGVILESLNSKIDCDGGNYPGSGLEEYINTHNVGLTLFDTILKDHVLTYPEGKGLALQGTYVYKNAVAGERYGYADFYNKCLEEYNDSSNEQKYLKSNVTKVGAVKDNQGVLSGFSSANYATLPYYSSEIKQIDITFKFNSGATFTSEKVILGQTVANMHTPQIGMTTAKEIYLLLSQDGTTWTAGIKSLPIEANTDYTVNIKWDGSKPTGTIIDANGNVSEMIQHPSYSETSNAVYWVEDCKIGTDLATGVHDGSIDLNESYININGERWWRGVETYTRNPNGHMFYDISQKIDVDNIFATTGMAWMYGIDQENERIFLPRNNWFEQFGDIEDVGKAIEAGLPNITGEIRGDNSGLLGAFYSGGSISGAATAGGEGKSDTRMMFSASRSNAVYGKSTTVQPNAVKKLLYICVGNTVSDTSWVDVVTQVEGGVKDLEDKTQDGLNRLITTANTNVANINAIGKSYDNVTHRNITNCLLEVPQNIKLELNNGTLTLKAGSEIIVPNGFEADGTTRKFDYVAIESDKTVITATGSGQYMILYKPEHTGWRNQITLTCFSGDTQPTFTGNYAAWYDTANNSVKITNDNGATWSGGWSLPLCLITTTTGVLNSVDQVFNGFGYIGSTIWVDKGVKGLIPNGRNEDGTLNNIELKTNKLITRSWGYQSNNQPLFISLDLKNIPSGGSYYVSDAEPISPTNNWIMWYNPVDNVMRYSNDNGKWTVCTDWLFTGIYTSSDTTANNYKLTQFTQSKQPFRAVDYNDTLLKSDKQEIISWGMPDYTSAVTKAKGTAYVETTNGWIAAYGNQNSKNFCPVRLDISTDGITYENVYYTQCGELNDGQTLFVPIPKGVYYKVGGTTTNSWVKYFKCIGE